MKYSITLEDVQLQFILNVLSEKPFKDVSSLINILMAQVQQQQREISDTNITTN